MKIVQIAATAIVQSDDVQTRYLYALDDDGAVWMMEDAGPYRTSDNWRRIPALPEIKK